MSNIDAVYRVLQDFRKNVDRLTELPGVDWKSLLDEVENLLELLKTAEERRDFSSERELLRTLFMLCQGTPLEKVVEQELGLITAMVYEPIPAPDLGSQLEPIEAAKMEEPVSKPEAPRVTGKGGAKKGPVAQRFQLPSQWMCNGC
jgi:hypothetical protein